MVVLANASMATLTSTAATRNTRLPRWASTRSKPLPVRRDKCAIAEADDSPASIASSSDDFADPSIKAQSMAVRLGSPSKLAM